LLAKGIQMLWLKSFHIVFVVTWYAVLFMLPRLFVYHQDISDPAIKAKFSAWERRTYILGHVAFGLMFAFGMAYLIHAVPFYVKAGWMHGKLLLVALQFAYFIYCGRLMKQLARGECTKSGRWLRLFNEIPAAFLIAITLLVVLQPGGVSL
jgi:protoporphyrinogen IX oxidase